MYMIWHKVYYIICTKGWIIPIQIVLKVNVNYANLSIHIMNNKIFHSDWHQTFTDRLTNILSGMHDGKSFVMVESLYSRCCP